MPDTPDARHDAPLIVACLRHTDPHPDVDPVSGAVGTDRLRAGTSASDDAALEHALRIAAAWSGRVLAVTAGPPAAEQTLRRAMAVGADVLRLAWPTATAAASTQDYLDDIAGDERRLADGLAEVIDRFGPADLVLCGDRSTDRGTGALPALLAHELGAAQALGLVDLTTTEDGLLAERRLDAGRRERLRIPRPAVCSVEAVGVRLRRASLPAVLDAGTARVATAEAAVPDGGPLSIGRTGPYRPRTRLVAPPQGDTPRERLLSLTDAHVQRDPPTIVEPVDTAEAADTLLSYLHRHGYDPPTSRT